jgi:hypothetical protein
MTSGLGGTGDDDIASSMIDATSRTEYVAWEEMSRMAHLSLLPGEMLSIVPNPGLARNFGSDPPTYAPTVCPCGRICRCRRRGTTYRARTSITTRRRRGGRTTGATSSRTDIKTDCVDWTPTRRTIDVAAGTSRVRGICATRTTSASNFTCRGLGSDSTYGLRDESLYRPTPMIMPNKLRLSYPERRSEGELPCRTS